LALLVVVYGDSDMQLTVHGAVIPTTSKDKHIVSGKFRIEKTDEGNLMKRSRHFLRGLSPISYCYAYYWIPLYCIFNWI